MPAMECDMMIVAHKWKSTKTASIERSHCVCVCVCVCELHSSSKKQLTTFCKYRIMNNIFATIPKNVRLNELFYHEMIYPQNDGSTAAHTLILFLQ